MDGQPDLLASRFAWLASRIARTGSSSISGFNNLSIQVDDNGTRFCKQLLEIIAERVKTLKKVKTLSPHFEFYAMWLGLKYSFNPLSFFDFKKELEWSNESHFCLLLTASRNMKE
ncbi:hypothetical protein L596_021907 [Steinernema carpocapsae]|uniref:Uncharacterized protein n=1 Tax=Steinernema carpocapsae TaxID=34508 RepID=A0A4U5MKI1_STECR|nr:hypothetical protein L596_021907 [Steinernema carpocapsae]